MSSFVNRPWSSTVMRGIWQAKLNPGNEQIHKIIRNHIASLDLGCPNMKIVSQLDVNVNNENLTAREKYLEWVRIWKILYKELSGLIRHYKNMARFTEFEKYINYQNIHTELAYALKEAANCTAEHLHGIYIGRINKFRMKESAQVLLNARYNAKLAAGAAMKKEPRRNN